MDAPLDEIAAKFVKLAMGTYKTRPERAALRCALGDAAHFCDAIGRAIEAENKGRNGKGATTKRGADLAAVAKRCGDAIWEMRDLVGFDDLDQP